MSFGGHRRDWHRRSPYDVREGASAWLPTKACPSSTSRSPPTTRPLPAVRPRVRPPARRPRCCRSPRRTNLRPRRRRPPRRRLPSRARQPSRLLSRPAVHPGACPVDPPAVAPARCSRRRGDPSLTGGPPGSTAPRGARPGGHAPPRGAPRRLRQGSGRPARPPAPQREVRPGDQPRQQRGASHRARVRARPAARRRSPRTPTRPTPGSAVAPPPCSRWPRTRPPTCAPPPAARPTRSATQAERDADSIRADAAREADDMRMVQLKELDEMRSRLTADAETRSAASPRPRRRTCSPPPSASPTRSGWPRSRRPTRCA